ncbi:MAG: hypothetical protein HZB99_03605 [Candidatus Harrisonbacteria bacterium]|nr:hypothetical protein [Candidatus Harrisonbacteria bacterium]
MHDYPSKISDENLFLLSRAYLERQAREWQLLKRNFTREAGMNNPTELENIIFRLIPKLSEAFAYYVNGLKNELELREEIKKAAQHQLQETWPHLRDEKKIRVSLAILSMYALTVFMAHGIQSELRRIFSDAIKFAEKNRLQPHQIFQDEKVYLIFIYKTETPVSYRKKLETIFSTASPARTGILFRRTKFCLEHSDETVDINSPPSVEEETIRKQCAISFLKQIITWPEVITQRVLEVFYPRP